jgi:hypothetical protein
MTWTTTRRAYIIEPKDGKTAPYLTLKENVADKRKNAGDTVTVYESRLQPAEPDEDDL